MVRSASLPVPESIAVTILTPLTSTALSRMEPRFMDAILERMDSISLSFSLRSALTCAAFAGRSDGLLTFIATAVSLSSVFVA